MQPSQEQGHMLIKTISALHYTAPGTDLTHWLENHVWESAGAINAQGEGFLPNMPTEESLYSA